MKSEDANIRYFTKSRVEFVVNALILAMILTLLVLPIYALYRVTTAFQGVNMSTGNAVAIGILLVATMLFAAILSLFTKAKRHEILGASAALVQFPYTFVST